MSIKIMEGFDAQHAVLGATMTSPSYNDISYGAAGRLGGYCLRSTHGFGGAIDRRQTFSAFGAASGTFAISAALRSSHAALDFTVPILAAREGATVHVGVRFKNDYKLELIRGDGTVLATSSDAFVPTAWNHFELVGTIHDTAGAATVKVNGIAVATVSATDTRNGGASGIFDTAIVGYSHGGSSPGGSWADIDDLVLADDNISRGNVVVETLLPSGTGDSSQWTNSAGSSVNNYSYVDDSSLTDYVQADTSGYLDLYALADGSSTFGTVLAVQSEVLGAKSDSGTPVGPLQIAQKGAIGTVTADTAITAAALTTVGAWALGPIKTLDPDGNAWTLARLNAMQVGVKVG